MQEAAEHIDFQFTTEHTRVGYLLDNTQNNDTNLRAATDSIRIEINGTIHDFETTFAFLLPVDPYSKQRNNSNKNAQIADVNLKVKFQSKTGVNFICYKKDEHKKLTKEKHAK